MPTYLRGRGGNIGGIIAQSGATFNGKVSQWTLAIEKDMHKVNGFGDAGNSYHEEGVGEWFYAFSGFVLSGVNLGVANLTGTASVSGTIALTADSGKVYYGSVMMSKINVVTDYSGGPVKFTGQGVGNGALNES